MLPTVIRLDFGPRTSSSAIPVHYWPIHDAADTLKVAVSLSAEQLDTQWVTGYAKLLGMWYSVLRSSTTALLAARLRLCSE